MRTVVDRSRSEFSKPAVNHEFAAFGDARGGGPPPDRREVRLRCLPQPAGIQEGRARLALLLCRDVVLGAPRYIGKNVQIEASDGRIRAYFEGRPIAEHELPGGRVNWDPSHYREALKAGPMRDAPDPAIEATAVRNLAAYDEIG